MDRPGNESNDTTEESTSRLTTVLLKSLMYPALMLSLYACLTAGLIAATYYLTAKRIADNQRQAQLSTLYQLAPKDSFDNDLLLDYIKLTPNSGEEALDFALLGPVAADAAIYIARKQGKIVQWLIPVVAPEGYTTAIRLWVGISASGVLTGVRVIYHQETPGLGDKIEVKKSSWVLQFDGQGVELALSERFALTKEGGTFDQLTGATITSRAMVNAVKQALLFFHRQRHMLERLAE